MSQAGPRPGDGSRRTLLAGERTYLAWLRTGLTTLAVGLAVARVVPGVSGITRTWPYTVLGVLFAVYGLVCIGYAERRRRAVDAAVHAGTYADSDSRLTLALTVAAVVLCVAVVLVLLVDA